MWSKKQEKEKKLKEEARNGLKKDKQVREAYFSNYRQFKNDVNQREKRDSERDSTVTPSPRVYAPRVYVPTQFENSLGRLEVFYFLAKL